MYTGQGKQTVRGHKQNLACTTTQEKGAVGPQETDPDVPECPEISSEGVGQQWPTTRLGALIAAVC